ncbi:MAG: hypothetical protein J6O56_05090 [Bacilli bacterium]|nr:hypothetical protein [Bacilli bacterium]
MKRLNLYRLITIVLIIALLLSLVMYKNKKVITVVNKKVVNPNYVFLGDSITDYYDLDKYYPNVKKVNSGIGGNRTRDILNDMENRVYKYNPSKVFLLIGINDILHTEESDYIVDDIKEITNRIHKKLPNCEIYIESIYPINEDCEKKHSIVSDYKSLNGKIVEDNESIEEFCKEKDYTFINVYDSLIDEGLNEKYSDDGLHLNDKGYSVVTKVLKKYM